MFRSFPVLFLSFLNVLLVNGGDEQSTNKYFPLVLIQHNGSLQYPKELESTSKPTDEFLHDVKFSRYQLYFNQIFFCPTDSPERKNQIERANEMLNKSSRLQQHFGNAKIGKNCLFKNEFKRGEPVQCTTQAVPVIYKVTQQESNDTPVQCGPKNKGTLFQFVYDLCPPITFFTRVRTFLWYIAIGEMRTFTTYVPFNYEKHKIYEICYDLNAKQTIYTKHELPVIGLLRNRTLKQDREKTYELSDDNYEYFGDNFQEDKEFYEELANQFKPHQLVPSLDMMSAILGKSTFHYINVQPMHEKIAEYWTYVEDIIRTNLDDDSDTPFQVYTGAFTAPQDSKTADTLVPNLWVKIVYMPKPKGTKWDFSLAIVMKNDYDHEDDDTFLSQFCSKDHCEFSKPNVRCCPVSEAIDELFGLNFYGSHILKIVNLMPVEPMEITVVRRPTDTSQS